MTIAQDDFKKALDMMESLYKIGKCKPSPKRKAKRKTPVKIKTKRKPPYPTLGYPFISLSAKSFAGLMGESTVKAVEKAVKKQKTVGKPKYDVNGNTIGKPKYESVRNNPDYVLTRSEVSTGREGEIREMRNYQHIKTGQKIIEWILNGDVESVDITNPIDWKREYLGTFRS